MQVPIRIRFSRKCKRCGLRYPEKEPVCPHCDGLTDQQVRKFKLRHNNELAGNANLGRLLLYVAGLLVVGMVIFMLNKS
jgi:threonine synthase